MNEGEGQRKNNPKKRPLDITTPSQTTPHSLPSTNKPLLVKNNKKSRVLTSGGGEKEKNNSSNNTDETNQPTKKKVRFNPSTEISTIPPKDGGSNKSGANQGAEIVEEGKGEGEKKLNNKQLKKLKQKRKQQKKKKNQQKQQEKQKNAAKEDEKNKSSSNVSSSSSSKKEQDEDVNERHRRDFVSDLSDYLQAWDENRRIVASNSSSSDQENKKWKFNKVLQEWALQHCLDKQRISSDLFKHLTPYLLTIQGKAKDRLIERLEEIIRQPEEIVEAGGEGKEEIPETTQSNGEEKKKQETAILLKSIARKRAQRLLVSFSKMK